MTTEPAVPDPPRALRVRFVRTAPKDSRTPNEDRCHFSEQACALSDGASISFDSAGWAEFLVRRFIESPRVDRAWITGAAEAFSQLSGQEDAPWYAQAARERGSFASLLGATWSDHGTEIQILSIGDSLAVVMDGEKFVESFSYLEPDQFDDDPVLLSSRNEKNHVLADHAFETRRIELTTFMDPVLFLMTDALGRWFLQNRDDAGIRERFQKFDEEEAFRTFIDEQRRTGALQRDDTTLVMIT